MGNWGPNGGGLTRQERTFPFLSLFSLLGPPWGNNRDPSGRQPLALGLPGAPEGHTWHEE